MTSDEHQEMKSVFGLHAVLPVENPGGSDFPGKFKKSKNRSSACGKHRGCDFVHA